MHLDIQGWILAGFISLGGVGLIFKFLDGKIKPVVHWLDGKLMAFPKIRDFVIGHRDEIKKDLDAAHEQIDQDIDEAK